MNNGKFIKKAISLLLCVFMTAAFAGCSSENNTQTQESTEAVTLTGETQEVDPATVVALRIYDASAETVLYTATWADTDVTDAFQQLIDNYVGVDGERTDKANYVAEYVGYDEYSTRWYDLWFEDDGTIQFAQNRIKSMSFDGSGTRQSNAMTVEEFYSITGLSPEA